MDAWYDAFNVDSSTQAHRVAGDKHIDLGGGEHLFEE
jgi:hypothetical protein